jgi:hypothetical protein
MDLGIGTWLAIVVAYAAAVRALRDSHRSKAAAGSADVRKEHPHARSGQHPDRRAVYRVDVRPRRGLRPHLRRVS